MLTSAVVLMAVMHRNLDPVIQGSRLNFHRLGMLPPSAQAKKKGQQLMSRRRANLLRGVQVKDEQFSRYLGVGETGFPFLSFGRTVPQVR
jgi:hypothetical protein